MTEKKNEFELNLRGKAWVTVRTCCCTAGTKRKQPGLDVTLSGKINNVFLLLILLILLIYCNFFYVLTLLCKVTSSAVKGAYKKMCYYYYY